MEGISDFSRFMTKISLIPKPVSLVEEGGCFVLHRGRTISGGSWFPDEAEILAETLRGVTGFALPFADDSGADISLAYNEQISAGAYHLHVGPDRVRIEASTADGAFSGGQTLLQLFPPAVFGRGPRAGFEWIAPCCRIDDAPRFRWRGMMLDSARHFQDPAWIKKWIDLLAQHKMNVFHWHLTDHQGWRIEIVRHPRLTHTGSQRRATVRGHYFADAGEDGRAHGGYYSQDTIREIVAYAARRHVTIVPEIDMPGHCQAALAAYPEWGVSPDPQEVWTQWGGHPALFNAEPQTMAALKDVLREVMDLFPSKHIHIGGDEAASEEWGSTEKSRACLASRGAKTPREMYGIFIREMAEFLAGHGRTLVGWDEIIDVHPLPGAALMSWRGHLSGILAAQRGQEVVMTPSHATYFDYYQSPSYESEPLGNRDVDVGFLSLENVHGFEPMPLQLSEAEQKFVLGIQGQLWTEYMPDTAALEYMAFPRACALAEVAWSSRRGRSFPEFRERLALHLKRLDCQGVRYRPLDR